MQGSFSRAFRLLRASWEVLRADRELLVLPLLSMLCMVLAAIPLIGGVIGLGVGGTAFKAGVPQLDAVQWVLLAIYYVVVYAIGIFFSAAVVGAATIRLQCGDPTLSDAFRVAFSKIDKILGWAVVSASVGLVLRAIEQRAGIFGRIVVLLIGAAWGAVTFFVVPVMLYEESGVFGSVKRSAGLFKQRWGEQFVGNGSIGIALFLIFLIPLLLGIGVIAAGATAVGIAVIVIGFLGVFSAGSVMSGIFNAALYRFATTGALSGPFTSDDLSGAFRPRGVRSGGSGSGGSGGGLGGLGGVRPRAGWVHRGRLRRVTVSSSGIPVGFMRPRPAAARGTVTATSELTLIRRAEHGFHARQCRGPTRRPGSGLPGPPGASWPASGLAALGARAAQRSRLGSARPARVAGGDGGPLLLAPRRLRVGE
ncbi:MAG TPA: DUF6159 family protein [Actinomycetota bacterium]|nr:DUF6159 family protein [Actinomycetota bacterium]